MEKQDTRVDMTEIDMIAADSKIRFRMQRDAKRFKISTNTYRYIFQHIVFTWSSHVFSVNLSLSDISTSSQEATGSNTTMGEDKDPAAVSGAKKVDRI